MAEQIATFFEKLDVQRQTYPDELIGICCPRNEDAEVVWAAILASPFASVSVLQKIE